MGYLNEKCGVLGIDFRGLDEGQLEKIVQRAIGLNQDSFGIDKLDPEIIDLAQEGMYSRYAAAIIGVIGEYWLRHRGQDSAGIAVSDGDRVQLVRGPGLVHQVLTAAKIRPLNGLMAILHNRYTITGAIIEQNEQPSTADSKWDLLAAAHNGNLVNEVQLRGELRDNGIFVPGTSDTSLIPYLIEGSGTDNLVDAIEAAALRLVGAYSLLVMTKDEIAVLRDPHGIRPLYTGEFKTSVWKKRGRAFASEAIALKMLGATNVRQVKRGEIHVYDGKYHATRVLPEQKSANCVFCDIYLARGRTEEERINEVFGDNVVDFRINSGRTSYWEHRWAIDEVVRARGLQDILVVPVRGSGYYAGVGFYEEFKLDLGATEQNWGVGALQKRAPDLRSFIAGDPEKRKEAADFVANREMISGKWVFLLEDSVVRGTTGEKLVSLLRDAGAQGIYYISASPEYKWPCFYGVATPSRDELFMAKRSIKKAAADLGVDYLGFLSLQGLAECAIMGNGYHRIKSFLHRHPGFAGSLLGHGVRALMPGAGRIMNRFRAQYDAACFTGEYPTELPLNVREKYLVN
ncbi:MAG: hypothetical protein ABH879_07930 [archaeon]